MEISMNKSPMMAADESAAASSAESSPSPSPDLDDDFESAALGLSQSPLHATSVADLGVPLQMVLSAFLHSVAAGTLHVASSADVHPYVDPKSAAQCFAFKVTSHFPATWSVQTLVDESPAPVPLVLSLHLHVAVPSTATHLASVADVLALAAKATFRPVVPSLHPTRAKH